MGNFIGGLIILAVNGAIILGFIGLIGMGLNYIF